LGVAPPLTLESLYEELWRFLLELCTPSYSLAALIRLIEPPFARGAVTAKP